MIFTVTIIAPTGVSVSTEIIIPKKAPVTAKIAAQIVTDLKLLNNRMAESYGKIIRADTNKDPTRFIASTIITAVITAIMRL